MDGSRADLPPALRALLGPRLSSRRLPPGRRAGDRVPRREASWGDDRRLDGPGRGRGSSGPRPRPLSTAGRDRRDRARLTSGGLGGTRRVMEANESEHWAFDPEQHPKLLALIVDDDDDFRSSVAALARREGFESRLAGSLEEARK